MRYVVKVRHLNIREKFLKSSLDIQKKRVIFEDF